MTTLNPHATALGDGEVTPVALRFEFETSFREQYIASLTVLSRLPLQIASAAIFPLAGILLIFLSFVTDTFSFFNALIIGLSFGFTPALMALNVWLYRRRNKTALGQFVYEFDTYGVRISGGTFDLKLKWEAIYKVRETEKFFLFFLSSRMAQFLPKRCIAGNERLSHLREFVFSKSSKQG